MKRFHVHLHVDDLAKSIAFYGQLFATEPSRREADYARWMLEDPRINFAISARQPGVRSVGCRLLLNSAKEPLNKFRGARGARTHRRDQ